MKKLLYCAAALATVFFAGSCQRENLEPVANGGVTYTITLPEAVQTKGEDGYAEYDLYLEVYKTVDAAELETATLLFEKKEVISAQMNGKISVGLDLLNDQDYTILFWANKKDEAWFNTADLRKVEMVQSASNNEDRDAYCAMDQIVNHNGAIAKTVELKRPFAQINIATEVPQQIGYDVTPLSSMVKVTGIPVAYNVAKGEPVGNGVEVTYTVNTIPEGYISTEYKKVAMNYVLVPEGTVDVYYEINTANGTVKNTVANVPVRANYRTNIIGNLLTSNASYIVEVMPGFESDGNENTEVINEGVVLNINGDYEISNAKGLAYALNNLFKEGGNFYLTASEYDMTGLNVTAPEIPANVVLNIYGETPVVTRATVPGVTIIGLDGAFLEKVEGKVTVSGVNLPEGDSVLVGTNNGTLIVYETTADELVGDGNEAISTSDIDSVERIQDAINLGVDKIKFGSDIQGNVTILQKEGVNLEIDGAGYNFDGVITVNGDARAAGRETLTLKNINFVTEGRDFTFITSPSKIGSKYNYSHNVTIEACTFTGNQTVGSASFTGTYNFVMKNCTATNMHSILQLQSVDNKALVENVTVNNCKNGISFGNTAFPTLKNSTITATEYGVRADGDASRGNLVIENTAITAAKPVIVRKVTTAYNVSLGEATSLNPSGNYHVVFTNGADDAAYVAPTGKWTISGESNYLVFPKVNYEAYGEKISDGLFKNEKTYHVLNAAGLVTLASNGLKAGEKVLLEADIDLEGVEFNGIDTFHPENNNLFDGKGHKVSNWTNYSGFSDMGFIRNWVGTIQNLTIENASLKTNGRSAIIVAKPYGNIENCHVVNCSIEDSYWACGLISGLYNAGNVINCSATDSYVKSNGGTGAIVGVLNETAGTRTFSGCSVTGCTVENTGDYGEAYCGAMVCGMINISNSTVKFENCTMTDDNTKVGKYVGDLYYAADDDITIVVE